MPFTRDSSEFSFVRMVLRCLTRPRLLLRLAGAAWTFRRNGWYRRPPFLPVPSREYLRWRLHTAFGDDAAQPDPEAIEAYLGWSARQRKVKH